MRSSARYGASAVLLVAGATVVLWPFLDDPGREGVLVAGAVALPVQIGSFALLQRFRSQLRRFLTVWIGGTVVRMCLIGAVAVFVLRPGTQGAAPALLALAAFFFALLLLEPVYFGRDEPEGVVSGP
jgi:hypothetical protein